MKDNCNFVANNTDNTEITKMKTKYIIYTRVSTRQQGASGLGLAAQLKTCKDYIASVDGEEVNAYEEVMSGCKRNRPMLWEAIRECKAKGATLVIAKLDRLARDVEFTFRVINEGIEIHFCDMPVMNTMILGVFASVAQYERELISTRTKAAMAASRALKGTAFGNLNGTHIERAYTTSAMNRRNAMLRDPVTRALFAVVRRCTDNFQHTKGAQFAEAAITLNEMGVKPNYGVEFDLEKVRAAYFRLKYIAQKQGKLLSEVSLEDLSTNVCEVRINGQTVRREIIHGVHPDDADNDNNNDDTSASESINDNNEQTK